MNVRLTDRGIVVDLPPLVLPSPEAAELKAYTDALTDRMAEDWPHIKLHLAAEEACRWLREGAPGRALEVLEAALKTENKTTTHERRNDISAA